MEKQEREDRMKAETGKAVVKIILGNLLITLAYAFITVPNHIVNGGVTSFSMVLANFLPLEISMITNILTILLLVMSYYFLGKSFLMKSLLSSICYMGFFSVLSSLDFMMPLPLPLGVLLAALMVGTGYYLCISAGSSTVGFDVLALVAHKRNEKVDVALWIRYINYGVLLTGLMSYGILSIVIGMIFTYLKTNVLRILLKREEKKAAEKKHEHALETSGQPA